MAKKNALLIGCLGCGGVLLLLLLLLVGGVSFIAYQAVSFGKEIAATYGEVAEEYKTLDKEFTFTKPEDGLLNEERTKTFLRVRAELAAFMEQHKDKLEETGDRIGKQFDDSGFLSKLRGIKSIKEIVQLAVSLGADIGKEHLRLLSDESMSPAEYQWLSEIYFGTLSKSKDNGNEEGETLWDQYIENFEKAREDYKDMQINMGKTSIHGSDMNRRELEKMLIAVPYHAPNAAVIAATTEALTMDKNTAVIDFLALNYYDILDDISANK